MLKFLRWFLTITFISSNLLVAMDDPMDVDIATRVESEVNQILENKIETYLRNLERISKERDFSNQVNLRKFHIAINQFFALLKELELDRVDRGDTHKLFIKKLQLLSRLKNVTPDALKNIVLIESIKVIPDELQVNIIKYILSDESMISPFIAIELPNHIESRRSHCTIFSTDKKYMVNLTRLPAIQILNPKKSWECIKAVQLPLSLKDAVVYSANSKYIIFGCNYILGILNVIDGSCKYIHVNTPLRNTDIITTCLEDKYIVYCANEIIRIWQLDNLSLVHEGLVNAIRFSDDFLYRVINTNVGVIKIGDTKAYSLISDLLPYQVPFICEIIMQIKLGKKQIALSDEEITIFQNLPKNTKNYLTKTLKLKFITLEEQTQLDNKIIEQKLKNLVSIFLQDKDRFENESSKYLIELNVHFQTIAIIEQLIAQGKSLDFLDKDGKSPLQLMLQASKIIDSLLNSLNQFINSIDQSISVNSLEFAQDINLLKYKQKLVSENAEYSIRKKQIDRIVKYLTDLVNSKKPAASTVVVNNQILDHRGNTPLHLAVLDGNFDLMRTLLENGADPRVYNNDGALPIHYAVGYGPDFLSIFLEYAYKNNK